MNLTSDPENFTLLEQVLEQADAVFFIFDSASGNFRYLSPVFDEVWEQERSVFFREPEKLLATVHPDDLPDLQAAWEQAHHRRKKIQEFRILCPDGKVKSLRMKPFYLLTEKNKQAIAGFVEDVSAAKDRDTTMLKYTAQKNSSLEILSHDLAGPLNIIHQLTNFLLEATQSYQNQDITQDLELIRETCARSVELIRELTNQEFLESVNAGLKKERLDLVERIGNIIDMYRQSERAISKTFKPDLQRHQVYLRQRDDQCFYHRGRRRGNHHGGRQWHRDSREISPGVIRPVYAGPAAGAAGRAPGGTGHEHHQKDCGIAPRQHLV
jgi:two-component system, OmpR family, sensor histidine kinase VicK